MAAGNMSTFKLAYYIVFRTKFRQPIIHSKLQIRLYDYIGGIIRKQKKHLFEIGGIEDHIHLLTSLSPIKAISDSIPKIKAHSSKWNNELPGPPRFE